MNTTARANDSCEAVALELRTLRTAELDEAALAKVVEQIKDLYLWFSPGSPEEDMRGRLLQHPNAYVELLLRPDNTCDGFSIHYTEVFNGSRVMFRGGTVVRPGEQSSGHYRRMLSQAISPRNADFVVAMTQNPRVYECLRSFGKRGVIYPRRDVDIPRHVLDIAMKFCKAREFLAPTLIVRNVYADIRKDASFSSVRDYSVESFFQSNLGPDDGFFVVVPLQ